MTLVLEITSRLLASKAQAIKTEIGKWDYIILRKFLLSKGSIQPNEKAT